MQIEKINFLKRSEVENIEDLIKKNYGTKIDLKQFLVFKSSEEKIWIVSKNILNLDLKKLKINSLGLYIGKLKRNNKIHLSLEGSQIVGKNANKNIVVLDELNTKKFMQGFDVKPKKEINCNYNNFVIVKFGEEILGSSLLTEEKLKNLIPKSRRII
jgi:NOL1/NOP2/fmu family ribosome biogenesis protein